jgi:hypothetical protein
MRAVQQVGPHVHVRKERDVLRHVTDMTAVRWHVDALRAREEHAPVDGNRAARGRAQAGDGIENGRLAGARRTEQRRRPGVELECGDERKRPLHELDVDGDHAGRLSASRFAVHNAAKAMAIEINSSVKASASCPVSAPL